MQGRTQNHAQGSTTLVHSVDGGLAVAHSDLADDDDLTGQFSLSATTVIVDVETGEQTLIRFPDRRNPLAPPTA